MQRDFLLFVELRGTASFIISPSSVVSRRQKAVARVVLSVYFVSLSRDRNEGGCGMRRRGRREERKENVAIAQHVMAPFQRCCCNQPEYNYLPTDLRSLITTKRQRKGRRRRRSKMEIGKPRSYNFSRFSLRGFFPSFITFTEGSSCSFLFSCSFP